MDKIFEVNLPKNADKELTAALNKLSTPEGVAEVFSIAGFDLIQHVNQNMNALLEKFCYLL